MGKWGVNPLLVRRWLPYHYFTQFFSQFQYRQIETPHSECDKHLPGFAPGFTRAVPKETWFALECVLCGCWRSTHSCAEAAPVSGAVCCFSSLHGVPTTYLPTSLPPSLPTYYLPTTYLPTTLELAKISWTSLCSNSLQTIECTAGLPWSFPLILSVL